MEHPTQPYSGVQKILDPPLTRQLAGHPAETCEFRDHAIEAIDSIQAIHYGPQSRA
jgi:hypothetical protein